MRASLLTLLLLATAACSRSPAPAQPASVALPPAPSASVAQSVPAGTAPQPAVEASVAGTAPAAATLQPAPGAKPAADFARKAPADKDPRWRDVDPNQLPTVAEPALAEFQAEQRRRDAELMRRDADEAEAVRDARAQVDDPRYREDPRQPEAYEDDRYADSRYDEPPPEMPYEGDEPDFEEPPYYEGDEEFDPALEEGYDPGADDDDYYRRR